MMIIIKQLMIDKVKSILLLSKQNSIYFFKNKNSLLLLKLFGGTSFAHKAY